jgi:hypothetical protein
LPRRNELIPLLIYDALPLTAPFLPTAVTESITQVAVRAARSM